VLHALEAFASSNQLIVTTHSPHLRDGVARGAVITLGELADAQDRPAVLSRAHG
jgi:predicted ATP-dependent endonuclease of OLD family